jgi:hypothetical protein
MNVPTMLEITLRVPKENARKIDAIKALRGLTGKGLKEAKDVIDDAYFRTTTAETEAGQNSNTFNSQLDLLRAAGFDVKVNKGQYEVYIDQLREMASMATLKGDYYIAGRLIEFLENTF